MAIAPRRGKPGLRKRRQPNCYSLLSHYRRLIHLRTENSALRRGDLTAVDSSYRGVYAFLRHDEQQALLVVTNLDDEPAAGSSLSLEGTDMALGEASLAFGRGALVPPRIKPQGGFEAYQPVETLAAQSLIVFEFETKPGQ